MATQPEDTIEHTAEYEDFIVKLRDYHAKRGYDLPLSGYTQFLILILQDHIRLGTKGWAEEGGPTEAMETSHCGRRL